MISKKGRFISNMNLPFFYKFLNISVPLFFNNPYIIKILAKTIILAILKNKFISLILNIYPIPQIAPIYKILHIRFTMTLALRFTTITSFVKSNLGYNKLINIPKIEQNAESSIIAISTKIVVFI